MVDWQLIESGIHRNPETLDFGIYVPWPWLGPGPSVLGRLGSLLEDQKAITEAQKGFKGVSS